MTLDAETIRELDEIDRSIGGVREAVLRVIRDGSAENASGRLWERLAESLEELGDAPSQSAFMREALSFFLQSIRQAQRLDELEAGYRALAADEERAQVIRAMRDRVPARFADD